jgi:RecB family exonuclease
MNNDNPGPKWPNLTPSRAGDLVCRKKYYTLHVLKTGPGESFSQALVYGQAVHDVFKRLYDPAARLPAHQADVEAVVNRVFAGYVYPDPADWETDHRRCLALVKAYIAGDPDVGATLGVEAFKSMPLSNTMGQLLLTLGARFDRLLVRASAPDCLVVRDYKTGKTGAADLQAACLMLAIARKQYPQYKTCVVEFDWVGAAGLVQRVTVTVAEAKEVWKDLKAAALRVYFATEHPAEPGEHCMFCPLKPECQPDRRATAEEIDALFEQD